MKSFLLLCLMCCGLAGYAQKDTGKNNDYKLFHWTYKTDSDQMTSAKVYEAIVYSRDTIYQGFPYDNKYRAYLTLVNINSTNAFYFWVEKGFIGSLSAKTSDVRVRFDEGQPIQYTFYFDKGGNKDRMSLSDQDASDMVKRLKRAKRLRMEVTFLGGRTQVIDFDVAGLKWNHMDKGAVAQTKSDAEYAKMKKGWIYTTDTDRMTSHIYSIAKVAAKEMFYFNSPYDGGSILYLHLENYENINYVTLFVANGCFTTDEADSINVRLRFDQEQPSYYTFCKYPDMHGEELYLVYSAANKLIDKLKKTKRLLVEAEYDDGGDKIAEFNVAGLKWNWKGKDAAPVDTMARKQSIGPSGGNPFERLFDNNSSSTGNSKADVNAQSSANVSITTHVTTTHTDDNGSNNVSTTEVAVNGAVVDATESSDGNKIILHCTYKNTNSEQDSITIHASFMDANGKVINRKAVRLGCAANSQVTKDITYQDRKGRYSSYRIEIY